MSAVAAAVSLELSADRLIAYRRSPATMVRELFHVEPDPWQIDVLEEFPHRPRQAMACCKGPGKTCTEAWLAWNFLLTRPHPKVAAVSITGKNLDDNLWPEMAKWHKRSDILLQQFEWTAESIFLRAHPETWFMTRKTWRPSANTDELGQTLAGLWAEYLLFLIDEAGGVPVPIMRTAEAALQRHGTEGHIVLGGNTTSTTGCLYEAVVVRRHLWECYEVSADPDDPKRTPRIDIDYARAQIKEYGREDPWVMINILAKFPSQGVNQLISADQVRECLGRHLHPHVYDFAAKILGGDVADFGDDRTVLFPRQGVLYGPPLALRQLDPVQIAGHWGEFASRYGADSIQVDATGGYGAGPIAILKDNGYAGVLAIQFSEKALNPKFYNKRAEIWWKACEHIKTERVSLPTQYIDQAGQMRDLGELVHELSSATYSYKGDQIILEPKELMKARLGHSPDFADALCCTHAYPVAPPDRTKLALSSFDLAAAVGKSRTDYDPLERA